MEKQLAQILQKTENVREFTGALMKFLTQCPQLKPIEFEKVFPQQHKPNTKKLLIKTVVEFQHARILMPTRDISINTDATRFQIIDLTIHDSVNYIKSKRPKS